MLALTPAGTLTTMHPGTLAGTGPIVRIGLWHGGGDAVRRESFFNAIAASNLGAELGGPGGAGRAVRRGPR